MAGAALEPQKHQPHASFAPPPQYAPVEHRHAAGATPLYRPHRTFHDYFCMLQSFSAPWIPPPTRTTIVPTRRRATSSIWCGCLGKRHFGYRHRQRHFFHMSTCSDYSDYLSFADDATHSSRRGLTPLYACITRARRGAGVRTSHQVRRQKYSFMKHSSTYSKQQRCYFQGAYLSHVKAIISLR